MVLFFQWQGVTTFHFRLTLCLLWHYTPGSPSFQWWSKVYTPDQAHQAGVKLSMVVYSIHHQPASPIWCEGVTWLTLWHHQSRHVLPFGYTSLLLVCIFSHFLASLIVAVLVPVSHIFGHSIVFGTEQRHSQSLVTVTDLTVNRDSQYFFAANLWHQLK